ncbi:MAG: hypothetical protein PVI37_04855 [Gammaproteobacteria bacterium]|jgi:hypothetical protein
MGIARSSGLDEFLGDAEDFEGEELDSLMEEQLSRKRERKPSRTRQTHWRDIEDYLENKRLRHQLKEFYEDEF